MKKKSLPSFRTFHLSISKHFAPRRNYGILALLNPRGTCSMELSGDLSQVVPVGFLAWPKLRRAVSLLITFLLLPPSLPKSSMGCWSAAAAALSTFISPHTACIPSPYIFGKMQPWPQRVYRINKHGFVCGWERRKEKLCSCQHPLITLLTCFMSFPHSLSFLFI